MCLNRQNPLPPGTSQDPGEITAITAALNAGVPFRDVQDFAGHADPRTTRRYDRSRHNLDRHATYALASRLGRGIKLFRLTSGPTGRGCPHLPRCGAVRCVATAGGRSRCPEDLVQVPFQEFPIRMVALPLWQGDPFAGVGVELFAVAEFIPQAWACRVSR
jgi:hypothetical protein